MDKANAHEDSKMFLEPTMSHTKNANKPQKMIQLGANNNKGSQPSEQQNNLQSDVNQPQAQISSLMIN